MLRLLALLLVCAVATLPPLLTAAPQRDSEARLAKLQAWLEAVESHTPGRVDAAARPVYLAGR